MSLWKNRLCKDHGAQELHARTRPQCNTKLKIKRDYVFHLCIFYFPGKLKRAKFGLAHFRILDANQNKGSSNRFEVQFPRWIRLCDFDLQCGFYVYPVQRNTSSFLPS